MTAVLCLGLVTACGTSDGPGGGYVNDGAAGPEQGAPAGPKAPDDDVRLIPLKKEPPVTDPDDPRGEKDERDKKDDTSPDGQAGDDEDGGGDDASADEDAGDDDGDPSGTPSPGESPSGPAKLSVGAHKRAPGDERRCERVTFPLHNSGGTAVTSGNVSFSTKIVGALGGNWGTVETRQSLRVPIDAGERTSQTYTVCVDGWRVPLGVSIETENVEVDWK